MPFQPLTKEQYQKAIDAGFSPDTIIQNEKKRQTLEMISSGKSAESFLQRPFYQQVLGSLNLGDAGTTQDISGFMTPEEQKQINRQSVATVAYGAPSKFISSAGEMLSTPVVTGLPASQRPTYKVPGLAPYQSFQTDAQKALEQGAKPFGMEALIKPAVGTVLAGLQTAGMAKSMFGDVALTARSPLSLKIPDVLGLKGGTLPITPGYEAGQFRPGLLSQGLELGTQKISQAIDAAKEPIVQFLKNNAAQEWARPTDTAKASYKAATTIFDRAAENGTDLSKLAVDDGIRLSENVTGKNYDTLETVQQIRTDAGQASRDMLRPLLEKVNSSVEYTPVEDVISQAKDDIGNSKFILPEDKLALQSKLDGIQSALETKYPDGMSLTDRLDEKILRDTAAKYNLAGEVADPLKSQMNKVIADVLRSNLKENVPPNIPYDAFQEQLQKQYQLADYLESLHTKPVPISVLGKMANLAGKVAGAATAQSLGGGILVDVGGYHIGGMVENILAGIPSQARDALLNSLSQTNPEVFNAMIDAMNQIATEQSSQLALPPPSSIQLGQSTESAKIPTGKGLEGKINYIYGPQGTEVTSQEIQNNLIPNPIESGSIDEKINSFIKDPSSIPLFRGENAANEGGLSFTDDKNWAKNFGDVGKPITLPKDSNIKQLTTQDMQDAFNKGFAMEADVYDYFFKQGYDAIVQGDSRDPSKLEIIINPNTFVDIRSNEVSPTLPPLKSINKGINKLYNTYKVKFPPGTNK